MIWENGTETCMLSCKKRIASLCSMQGEQSSKRQCLQMGLKTLDLKDVSEILIIYSQFSSHTMMIRVSTFYGILYSQIYFILTESTYDLLKTFFGKWLKGLRNKLILLQNKNLFYESDYMKIGLLLTMFPYYREVDSINFHHLIGKQMHREF